MAKITQKVEQQPQTESNDSVIANLVAKINAMEAALAEKEKKGNTLSTKDDKYEWPLEASYWLRDGQPVLSFVSVKWDSAHDWRYKNHNWVWVNNHFVQVTTTEGELKKKLVRDDFDWSKTLSPKQKFGIITSDNRRIDNVKRLDLVFLDKQGFSVKNYVFNTPEGELIVSPNCIN